MGYLDTHTVSLVCPGCGHASTKTVKWIKENDTLHCHGCGQDITLQRGNLLPGLEEAEKAIDGFLDDIRGSGKR